MAKESSMDPAIAKELAALREEIEALRAASAPKEPPAGAEAAAPPSGPAAWGDPIRELFGAMQGAFENAESSVVVHPIAGVAAAFLAGLLIGRATKS